MSDYVIIQKDTLTAMGDVVRDATGETKLYTLDEMYENLQPVPERIEQYVKQYVERDFNANLALIEGLPRIGGEAFYKVNNIINVVLPKSLHTIVAGAFRECENLTSVTFKSTPTSLASNTFVNCANLVAINVPWSEGEVAGAPWGATNASINYNHANNSNNSSCDVLIKKETLETLSSKIQQLLENTGTLSVSQMPNRMSEVFFGINSLSANQFIDEFNDYYRLLGRYSSTFNLPVGITLIPDYAFFLYIALREVVLPDGIASIGDNAFYGCEKLASINFPEGLTSIGARAFWGCPISSIIFPESLTDIGIMAFANCTSLREVTFRGTPNSIGDGTMWDTAFSGCGGLTTINVPWSEGEVAGAPWGADNATINYNYVSSEE